MYKIVIGGIFLAALILCITLWYLGVFDDLEPEKILPLFTPEYSKNIPGIYNGYTNWKGSKDNPSIDNILIKQLDDTKPEDFDHLVISFPDGSPLYLEGSPTKGNWKAYNNLNKNTEIGVLRIIRVTASFGRLIYYPNNSPNNEIFLTKKS